MTFKELNIIQPVLKAIEEKGYTEPTPIQQKAIPAALSQRDVLGCAQTGTGKTASFAIPIIQFLQTDSVREKHKGVKALILTPTRPLYASSPWCDIRGSKPASAGEYVTERNRYSGGYARTFT